MKNSITERINDPEALERLYRENKPDFTREILEMDDSGSALVKFWKIRLSYDRAASRAFSYTDLGAMLAVALLTALLVKLPALFTTINDQFFYTRDLAIIAFNGLIIFTGRQNHVRAKWMIFYAAVIIALTLYVNLLPSGETDSLNLAFVHVPLFLWCIFGAAFTAFDLRAAAKRIEFIRFNGELLIMTGLLLITGGILTAITIGLFSAIGMNIEKLYFDYIVIPGAAVSPILASYLFSLYPDITRRIVPVIARVFTPVVLVTLVIYLIYLAFSKISIMEDRNLLALFNVMLVAVLALIIFSITELDKSKNRNPHVLILLILAIVTLVINTVALTAIINRVTFGFTPNRTVVLATNVLVFINLILITRDLYRSFLTAEKLVSVEKTVANYLTVYFCWTVFAIFFLPAIFGYN